MHTPGPHDSVGSGVSAWPDVDLLAVYGTLRRGFRNHHLTVGRAQWLGEGRMPGRLLHVGGKRRAYPYPAYLPDASGSVVVEVLRVTDPGLWPDLHELESYLPYDLPASEYLLVRAQVSMPSGARLPCVTYAYNRPRDRRPDVPNGDWATVSADVWR